LIVLAILYIRAPEPDLVFLCIAGSSKSFCVLDKQYNSHFYTTGLEVKSYHKLKTCITFFSDCLVLPILERIGPLCSSVTFRASVYGYCWQNKAVSSSHNSNCSKYYRRKHL